MAQAAEVRGLREFRAGLAAAGAEFPAMLRKTNKEVADKAAADARSLASSGTRQQAAAAAAIVGQASQTSASVGLGSAKRIPFSSVAFWGATKHTGWYADPKYANSPPQHPPWVGNNWEPAIAGQGPYCINDALAKNLPELIHEYDLALEVLARQAFTD